jgi:phosphoribosyl 1,2-cyclic phosphodiesterase
VRFASLGSGSRGNATLVQAGDTVLMVDCGFSAVETERRLTRLGLAPDCLAAILVTHEHSDHVSGVARFAARHGITVWSTAGTRIASEKQGLHAAEAIHGEKAFALGDIQVTPVTVPHDAREPVQFVFSDGACSFGLLTDTGAITPHIVRMFRDCAALLLECNHDVDMLEQGPYPEALKERVGGPLGHLSNGQAADFLRRLGTRRLQHLVAAHLSEKNNTPTLAREALAAAAGCSTEWIAVAQQDAGLAWRSIA